MVYCPVACQNFLVLATAHVCETELYMHGKAFPMTSNSILVISAFSSEPGMTELVLLVPRADFAYSFK